jgi:hypothetical protein
MVFGFIGDCSTYVPGMGSAAVILSLKSDTTSVKRSAHSAVKEGLRAGFRGISAATTGYV